MLSDPNREIHVAAHKAMKVHGVLSAELAALRKSTSDAEHTKQEL